MEHFWAISVAISCFKCLLFNSYKSTDFEVHRNWLAITYSLPPKKWYTEDTSEWTLDYPPLFAWFEKILSVFAWYFDKEMLKIQNLNYDSPGTVLFQRLSVVIGDILLMYGAKEFCTKFVKTKVSGSTLKNPRYILFLLISASSGLLIVDHIHFQYNGFLYGILLLSITRVYEFRNLEAAIWFSTLLNLKHIYLYIALPYFVYLMRHYLYHGSAGIWLPWRSFSFTRTLSLGVVVIGVFAASFGPFIYMGQLAQVLSRLFPFKRGLCHAYWAPNFWTLYNVADKAALLIGKRMGLNIGNTTSKAVMTGGLVQEFDHVVLPSITPFITFILIIATMWPSLYDLWSSPRNPLNFVKSITLCAFSSFLFGWHVHEKAILMVILPLSLLIFEKKNYASLFLLLSTIGYYSLFPLIFTKFDNIVKMLLLGIHVLFAFLALGDHYREPWRILKLPLLNMMESIYLLGIIPLEIYNSVGHHYILNLSEKFPFLPLLLTSFYCSIGIVYCWVKLNLTLHRLTKIKIK